jgi:L-aspartate oxidase
MAGNSLTEAVVFGRRAAHAMTTDSLDAPPVVDVTEDEPRVRMVNPDDWSNLRRAMSTGAGLVRSRSGLEGAERTVSAIAAQTSGDLRAAAIAARLICASALRRDESRGVHFRSDAPEPLESWDGRHVSMTRDA